MSVSLILKRRPRSGYGFSNLICWGDTELNVCFCYWGFIWLPVIRKACYRVLSGKRGRAPSIYPRRHQIWEGIFNPTGLRALRVARG